MWTNVLNDRDLWDKCIKQKWTVGTGDIYHVAAAEKKTRWNFECPTHHPVPTVAIILGKTTKLKAYSQSYLGCFIPITIILIAIIGIQWCRGQNGQQNKKAPEEQAAVDEIPPAENA